MVRLCTYKGDGCLTTGCSGPVRSRWAELRRRSFAWQPFAKQVRPLNQALGVELIMRHEPPSNVIVIFRVTSFPLAFFTLLVAAVFARYGLALIPASLATSFALAAALFLWFGLRGHHLTDRLLIIWSYLAGVLTAIISGLACLAWEIEVIHRQVPVAAMFLAAPFGFIIGAIAGLCITGVIILVGRKHAERSDT